MAQIDLVFADIFAPDPELYLEQRLRAMRAVASLEDRDAARTVDESALRGDVARIRAGLAQLTTAPPPLAPTPRLSDFPKQRRLVARQRKTCLLQQIRRRFPLLDGEQVRRRGDQVTYLAEAWAHYEAGTVVVRRTTNRSVSYYLVPDARALPGKQRVRLGVRPATGGRGEQPALRAYVPRYGDAARELAKGLAGLGSPPLNFIGVFLINAFWPNGGGQAATTWEEIYRNLQTILKNGLAEDKVNTAATKVKGFVNFLTNEYQALKQDPKTRRDDLMRALAPYDVAFFMEIVNVFMYEDKPTADIAAASLANFMLGANLHIALNQERALVDPHHVKDPEKSAYAITAANLARTYSAYARKAAPQVEKRRLAQISAVKEREHTSCPSGGMGICVSIYWYWFEDANDGYRSKDYSYSTSEKHPPDAKKQATEARAAYVKKIRAGLNLQSQVYDVADYWDKVAKDPIGLHYGPPVVAPKLDPEGWAGTVPVRGSRHWVEGYQVRYAVSFVEGRIETPPGPWWSPPDADAEGYLAGSPKALPRLIEVPVDPFFRADARRIYRQFRGGKPQPIATIANHTDTDFQDETP